MKNAFQLHISKEGVAELVFDEPDAKVNSFSLKVLEELEGYLDQLRTNNAVKVLKLVSAKQDSYIAGADLKSIAGAFDKQEEGV
jgi:3-hydroxyacyl-CoA dehydrogenase/enoyl-CoA hydratase/3-hydroxybutyryl-CoA epimerase